MLAPQRQDKWICIKSSCVFDNPTQATHTLLDYCNIKHKDSNLDFVENILSFNQDGEIVNNMKEFCETWGLTLTLGEKYPTNFSAQKLLKLIQLSL